MFRDTSKLSNILNIVQNSQLRYVKPVWKISFNAMVKLLEQSISLVSNEQTNAI